MIDEADIIERYEERASMREFEGNARRGFAEQRAAADVIKQIRDQQEPPQWLVEIAEGERYQKGMLF